VAVLRAHRWFAGSALASLLLFAWIVTGGSGRLLEPEAFGDFYDYQAASLLKGRLDVPGEALGFEAFVFEGKHYAYFGLTPALLRLPFVILNVGAGELSRLFMLSYFAGALLAGYLILLHVAGITGVQRRLPAWAIVLFVANAGLGNTFLFLGSRAYVYHEAILCGAVFALWSVWCALRHWHTPAGRWWLGAIVCGLMSVHARPPTGLFALSVIGLVACALAFQRWRAARAGSDTFSWNVVRQPLGVATLAAASVLTFNGLSYLKFRTFNGCPLEYHVQYDAARLAQFDGRQFHVSNLPFGADAYLLRPNFEVKKYFPYLHIGGGARERFPNARMDLVEPLLGFPYVMPALFGLATAGSLSAFAIVRGLRPALLLIWGAALPLSLVMFAAVAHSHRYTADFCPLFISAAAFGLVAVNACPAIARRAALAVLTLLTMAGMFINVLLALHYQGETVWGVPEEARSRYAALRRQIDGMLGVQAPQGYSTAALPIRQVDAAYYTWRTAALLQKTETLAGGVALYERHLQEQRYFHDIHFALADVYVGLHRPTQAIAAIERGLAINPNAAKAQARLGELLAQAGRLTEAVERYKAALQLVPNYAVVHNNIGAAYAGLGQLADAVRHIEQACLLDPNYAEARSNLERLRAAQRTPQ
jgi:hypothetical protein